jgi:hypothetical protein
MCLKAEHNNNNNNNNNNRNMLLKKNYQWILAWKSYKKFCYECEMEKMQSNV